MPIPLQSEISDPGIRRAARACGSYAELARRLGITPGAICGWHKIPDRWIRKIEKVTGVPKEMLRPDLYD